MTLIEELKYNLNINRKNIDDLSDFETKWSINSARELKLLFESEKGNLSEKYHIGDEIRFHYGIGKINSINDFHGICLGIDLNEYSLLNYDWLAKLIDEKVKISAKKYLGWEKMSVIKDVIQKSSQDKIFRYININEDFIVDPPDWVEVGSISTYDAGNKLIDIIADRGSTKDRYSKEHIDLTDDDTFYMEFKVKVKTHDDHSAVVVGGFKKNEADNQHNFIGLVISRSTIPPPAINNANILVIHSDGTSDNASFWDNDVPPNTETLADNTEYTMKFWYDGVNRKLTGKLYIGDVWMGEGTLTLSSIKDFTVNDFGVGNLDDGSYPTDVYEIDYDDAILQAGIPDLENLKGTYPQQYITPYDNLTNDWKDSRFDFIKKVLNSMYDATDWHEIKLYEMWVRYGKLIIQKQRSLTSTPVMTIADADNLITTKPVIDKERICNRCTMVDEDDDEIYFTYSVESSIEAYGLFHKSFKYKAYGQVDKCQEMAMKYVAKHKMPTKVFGLSCAEGYMLQLGDIVEVTADRYGIKGNYRITDILVRASDLPSAEITVSDKQPDISEFI